MQLSHFVAKLLPKMQFSALTILFALSICALKPNVESGSFVFEVTFPTRIDHFNPTNQNLTKFFYHVNTKYFRHGGPAYIYIKDINDQSTKWIESGLMVDIARTTGALLLTFDMRFFGKNRPTSDASVESLALLTVDQSLADIAVFIRFVRKSLKEKCSTVILWGSGYGAALAAWARQRYPHLVAGSWASSGSFYPSAFTYVPIEQLRLLIVNEKGSPDYVCRDNLEQVYKMLNKLIENGDGKYISDKFNLCGQVYTDWKEDVAAFYELIIKTIFDYIDHYHFNGIKSLCSSIENQKSDDLLDAFANWFYTAKMKLSSAVLTDVLKYCSNHNYDGIVSDRNEYEWDSYFTYSGKRQWRYLQCTQLGGFLITNMLTWIPQRITRDYHMKKCNKAFGTSIDFETLEMAVTNLDAEFDNLDPNILYTASEMDPFKIFTRAFDSQGESITIDDFAKSSELASVSADDSPSLYKAKKFVSNLITKWSTNQDENSSEDLKNRHILDLSFRYREVWWELSGENKEWDDNDWAKVYDMMLSVAGGKNGLEETINDETEAQVMDEDGSIGAMDDVSDERFDDVENDELQKLFDLLKNPEEQDPDGNSKEDQILSEAIMMVELALKFTKMNYDVCDDDGNIYDEMDDISQWYSTKIFENWAQPMDFLKIDDKFKRNYKLAMEWLDNDLYKLDFENEFKNVDTNEFRILYITSKLSLEYDKYRTEGSSRFWMSEDV